MDFVADGLFDGRRLSTLAIVDNYTRGCLAIEVNGSLKGGDVVAALTRLSMHRAKLRSGASTITRLALTSHCNDPLPENRTAVN
ncbi:hypothetical protein FHW67_003949 [Herbaspirillum sp. Sphag1AN]|nr:hypothetical protein [Herbaspirillum sp. Sphag1AN]MBB3247774.1 hypothetical protein [Herbaspirillum sp. Sphag64]